MSQTDSQARKAARARAQRDQPKGPETVHITEFITDGERVARRNEVLGVLMWIEGKRRSNVWWRRILRWTWLHIPFIPKPPKGSLEALVDRDPYRMLAARIEMEHRQRVAEKEAQALGSKPRIVES